MVNPPAPPDGNSGKRAHLSIPGANVDMTDRSLTGRDIEMGSQGDEPQTATPNPLHHGRDRGNTIESVASHLSMEAEKVAEKTVGRNIEATQGVNMEALDGQLIDKISIAINFVQSFGLTILIDVEWPDSFKNLFSWIEVFSLDIGIFGGEELGEWIGIWIGLLLPIFLIWMFDCGVFRERKRFGTFFLLDEDKYGELDNDDPLQMICGTFCGTCSIMFLGLAIGGTAAHWYGSNFADALFIVFSGFYTFWFLNNIRLWRSRVAADIAKEDFCLTRQGSEAFVFLFLYTVVYLSGVSTCVTLATMDNKVMVIGFVLLPFYMYTPVRKLYVTAEEVKNSLGEVEVCHVEETGKATFVKEKISEEDANYEDKLMNVRKRAKGDLTANPPTGVPRVNQELNKGSSAYKTAVIAVLLGSFEEGFWFWKVVILLERAMLAIFIGFGLSAWATVCVAGVGWLASFLAAPYKEDSEDRLDSLTRLTTFATCLGAALIEQGILQGDELWLSVILCSLGIGTLLLIVGSIGPFRLLEGVWKYVEEKRLGQLIKQGEEGIKKLTESEAQNMRLEQFEEFADDFKWSIALRFPHVPVVVRFGELNKFTNGSLKFAIKKWHEKRESAENLWGPISEWDVSEVTSMEGLFEGATDFNGDITSWNVGAVTNMERMFKGCVVFNQDLSAWNVSEVTSMEGLFEGATDFNGDITSWNVGAVTNMERMFKGCEAFNEDITGWKVEKVEKWKECFEGTTKLDMEGFEVLKKKKYTNETLKEAVKWWVKETPEKVYRHISFWDVSEVTSMEGLFEGAKDFNEDLSRWNTGKVEIVVRMFSRASSFNSDLSCKQGGEYEYVVLVCLLLQLCQGKMQAKRSLLTSFSLYYNGCKLKSEC